MVRFLLNKDHDLIVTSSTHIHRGDNGVGNIEFVIPNELDGLTIADLELSLRYTLPNGDTYEVEIEEKDDTYKEGYTLCSLPIDKDITSISGSIELDLIFKNDDAEIHSGISHITILPNSTYYVTKINNSGTTP